MKKELVEKLIGKDIKDLSFWEAKYPPRPVNQTTGNAQTTTRVAPSPTGFMHIGGIFQALINSKLAHQNNGVFYLRVEDTDTKREVSGATDVIIRSLNDFALEPDEGPLDENGNEKGAYASYFQSRRADIYKSGVKYLLEKDLAYPCFCNEDDTERARKEQTVLKIRPGYYGKWAKCRTLSEEQIEAKLDEGAPFIIRFKSSGNWDTKKYFDDLSRGKILMPENDLDIVILKKDGLPTYHFAHAIDDHFMRTTHVIRSDEWIASLPLHVQLFEAMGWTPPRYAHTAPIQKLDEGNRRKLSKRKDPEAGVMFYFEQGYPVRAVKEYVMNLANSNFEDFKKTCENPAEALDKFEFRIENLNASGALLDLKKLDNISRDVIAGMSSAELYRNWLEWAKTYDAALAEKLEQNKPYILQILAIERDGAEKVRKDFVVYSKIWDEVSYFFDDGFKAPAADNNGKVLIKEYIDSYDENATKEQWFDNVKRIAAANGYALNAKEFKAAEPGTYKGTLSDAATVFRMAITGRTQSPDLYAIQKILGKERTLSRLKALL